MSVFPTLIAQRIRRDRWQLLLWIGGATALAAAAYSGVTSTFGTEQERTALLAAAIANPVILLFRGLPSGSEEGAFMVFLIFPWLAFLAAFMSTFLAVRHTRGDEESGRLELVSATPAGRMLPLTATLVHGLLANAALGILIAVTYIAVGLPVGGALLVGSAVGSVGAVFLALGLTTAQLMRTSRGANATAVWTTVVLFVIAGVGNAIGTPSDDLTRMKSSGLTWISPFGWGENTRAFDDDAWWPVILCLAVTGALSAVAFVLAGARDLGESLVAEGQGPRAAPRTLSSSTGLAWRLTRGAIVGWALGGFLVGLLSTSLASIVDDVGSGNPAIEGVLAQLSGGGDLEQATVTTFFTMLGVLAACAAVQTVCRARQEETHGTAEPLLSSPVARVRWLADYVCVGAAGIVLIVLAGVAGAAIGIATRGGAGDLMTDVWVSGGGQAVAASVFLAATALVFVVAPRLTIALGWTLVLAATMIGLFGPLLGLPEALTNASPIAAAPHREQDAVDLAGLWWLLSATGVGLAASLTLTRRRELFPAG
ncbi:ABC transporter permease [Microbacterium sp. RU33B]|uniref:ABC transporter permease n=1 Tax=Microbacterium sp. RU33B TaxID=1907390 RepID=UPI00096262C9|nr:polyketide antibiotic transporter [Microbacterium sp. RU33B]SIT86692.1 ABC-2 type transport system permease protein [Microbacterium sp. RU33B]